ncbi:MAG TPA: hypothetical protein VEV87_10865, partial [Chitinophagaceae bacterium]|nr:hypothetical protein [Chitinophagaceae bacterium]
MKVILNILILATLVIKGFGQPYIDLANCKYTASPGFNPSAGNTILNYANVSFTLPLKFKNTDVLIISPFGEKWTAEIDPEHPKQSYYGLGLPVSYLKNFKGSNTSVIMTAILKMNDEQINNQGTLQIGGAALITMKKKETLTWKFGLYVNGDLFGVFIIPLAGIDWKINEKSNLFGILPANLTYERKLGKKTYSGFTFRTFTNSYAKDTGYWRVDENQLGAFMDFYLTKNLVINGEAGSSVLRKIRTGVEGK